MLATKTARSKLSEPSFRAGKGAEHQPVGRITGQTRRCIHLHLPISHRLPKLLAQAIESSPDPSHSWWIQFGGGMVSDELGRRNYTLLLNDGTKEEFLAVDAAEALKRAQTVLPKEGSALLMEDGAPLAEITCSPEGF